MSDFYYTYICDIFTYSQLCSVCAETKLALHLDISSDSSSNISTNHIDVVNVVPTTVKMLPSIKEPFALELKPLPKILNMHI